MNNIKEEKKSNANIKKVMQKEKKKLPFSEKELLANLTAYTGHADEISQKTYFND